MSPAASDPVVVAFEEFLASWDRGENPDLQEFLRIHEPAGKELEGRLRAFLKVVQLGNATPEGKPDRAAPRAAAHEPTSSPAATNESREIGEFLVLEELGRGGMGVVYLAEQVNLERRVALKVLPAHLTLSDKQIERFHREATAAARLNHKGIVPIYTVGEAGGIHYFAMEYVEGGTLLDALDELRSPRPNRGNRNLLRCGGGGLSYAAQVAKVVAEIAEALAYAHAQGIVHRDVKPQNILMRRDPEGDHPMLVDFGLAIDIDRTLTASRPFAGTPFYMSPEQASGGKTDPRTDVFSLGIVLYEILTLKRPFRGRTSQAVLNSILHREPAPIRRANPTAPRDLITICGKALEKDPAQRYESAAALAEDLRRFLAFEPIAARPAGPLRKTLGLARRHRFLTAVALLVFVAALIVTGFSILGKNQRRREVDGLLRQSEATAAVGDFESAISHMIEAVSIGAGDPRPKSHLATYRKDAEIQAVAAALQRSEGMRLVLHSSLELENNPGRALILAAAGAERSPGLLANNALYSALTRNHEIKTLVGHTGWVQSAEFDSTGTTVLTCSLDGSVRLWDAATGTERSRHELDCTAFCASFDPTGTRIAVALDDGTARILSSETGATLQVLEGHEGTVTCARFDRSGDRLVTAGVDSTARIFDLATGETIHTLREHNAPGGSQVFWAEFSPDGTRVVTASADSTARIWDASTGRRLKILLGHRGGVLQACFDADSSRVVTASMDHTARVFEVETGDQIGEPLVHSGSVTSARFVRSQRVVTATAPNEFYSTETPRTQLWNLRSREVVMVNTGHEETILQVSISPDRKRLVTASADGTARIWDTWAWDQGVLPIGYANHVTFSKDGKLAAVVPGSGGRDHPKEVELFEFPGGLSEKPRLRRGITFEGPEEGVISANFDANAEHLVLGCVDGTARVYQVRSGDLLAILRGHSGEVLSAEFDKSGSRVVTAGSWDETAIVFDWSSERELARLEGHEGQVSFARFDPAGRRVLTVSGSEQECRLFDAFSGELITSIPWTENEGSFNWPWCITAADFSPDGERLVIAESANRARIVSAADGEEIVSLIGHRSAVLSVDFDATGERVVTSSMDATARLWDSSSGELLAILGGHEAAISHASFTPDGNWILTVSLWDGLARLWPISPLDEARKRLPRQLTPEEKKRFDIE